MVPPAILDSIHEFRDELPDHFVAGVGPPIEEIAEVRVLREPGAWIGEEGESGVECDSCLLHEQTDASSLARGPSPTDTPPK